MKAKIRSLQNDRSWNELVEAMHEYLKACREALGRTEPSAYVGGAIEKLLEAAPLRRIPMLEKPAPELVLPTKTFFKLSLWAA